MRAPSGTGRRAGILLCIVLAVTACSDPEPPGTLPDRTPSASSTSASRTPATPEEEVEAAVRAYYAELSRAAQTQDTDAFKELVTSGCPCFKVATAIDKVRRAGKSTPDAAWTVESINVRELDGGSALAEVKYEVDPYKVMNSRGEVVDRYPRQHGHVDLSFVLSNKRWIVGNLFDLEG